MEFAGYVECECGHRFFTTKDKPQCSKCKKRFFSLTRVYSMLGQEKDRTIASLQDKIIRYEEIIKKLIPKLEKEQKENLEELRSLLS